MGRGKARRISLREYRIRQGRPAGGARGGYLVRVGPSSARPLPPWLAVPTEFFSMDLAIAPSPRALCQIFTALAHVGALISCGATLQTPLTTWSSACAHWASPPTSPPSAVCLCFCARLPRPIRNSIPGGRRGQRRAIGDRWQVAGILKPISLNMIAVLRTGPTCS